MLPSHLLTPICFIHLLQIFLIHKNTLQDSGEVVLSVCLWPAVPFMLRQLNKDSMPSSFLFLSLHAASALNRQTSFSASQKKKQIPFIKLSVSLHREMKCCRYKSTSLHPCPDVNFATVFAHWRMTQIPQC